MPGLGMVPPDEWKERTSLVFSRRGSTTLQVDAAYAAYYASRTEQNADRLYFLLEKYLREHSGRWSSADRNLRSGGLMQAVYNLSRQHAHAGLGLAQFSNEKKQYGEELVSEADALQFWKEQRQTIAQRFFENCSLDWKSGAQLALGISAGVVTTANLYNIADGALVVRKLVNQIAAKAVDPTVMAEVLQFIERSGMISEATREFAGSLIPLKGLIINGGSAVGYAILACRDVYRQYDVERHAGVIDEGSPHAALLALSRIVERERNRHLRGAAQNTLAAGARAAGLVLDPTQASQAIIGAATAIANLTQRIYLINRNCKERRRANEMIVGAAARIDASVFGSHPILGCYFLVAAESSTILAFFGNFGNKGWMDEVEDAVKKHLAPLQDLCGTYIDDCSFHLVRNGVPVYAMPGKWKRLKKWKNGKWDTTKSEQGGEVAGEASDLD